MEAINYANGANMTLPADAQIVQGVSGNAVYLPAGAGTMPIAGNRNELTISLWRQWDGVVEADDYRGIFKTANIKAYFDQATDFLTIELAGTKTVTDIKDDQEQTHWCFLFSKNSFFKIYKNAELKAEASVGNYPVDFSEGFTLGGGRTHAIFDEVLVYVELLKQEFINGLYHIVSKGTVLGHVEHLIEQSVPLHTPRYLGTVKTPPEGGRVNIALGPKNGFNDASIGDWILIIEPLAQYQKGWCYRWTGSVWQKLDPPANYTAEYSACLKDQLEKCKDLFGDTNFFGSVFCQFLGFNKAVGESLAANTALLDNLTVKRLLVDNDTNDPLDFELAINRDVGILAKNNGEAVFEINPLGDVFAKNAFLQDGTFIGEIKNQSFKVLKRDETDGILFEYPNNTKASTIFNNKGEGEWNVSGKYGENMVSAVKISSYWEHLEDGSDLPVGKEKKYKHWHGIKFSFENKPSITFSFGTIEWWFRDYNTGKETYMSTVSSWDDTISDKMKLYQQNLAPENIFFPQLSEAIPNKPSQVFFQRINGRKVLCIT